MTIDDPQKDKAFPVASVSGDLADAELVSAGQRVNAGGPAPARRVDYRLRGLDFDASAVRAQFTPPPVIHKKHPSRIRRRRRLLVQFLVVLALLASTAVVLRAFVLQPYVVRSTSMVPEIQAGTHVLVLRPSVLTGSVKLGDVIVFHQPKSANCVDGSQDLVKRVIALPGQKIWSDGQRIYIDGRVIEEPGWYNVPFGELGPTAIPVTTVAADSYYVLGDNRTDPCDSRAFGAIAGSSIVGKVVASTWRGGHPFAHFV